MRGYVPAYALARPATLAEALTLVATGHRPFAGGTDLMVMLEAGKLTHKRFVSIAHLSELHGIAESDTHVTLGALTTYGEILAHPLVEQEFPSLRVAARETGARAIQNRGTLGGNIANASPAADSPPALLVYDAELQLCSTKGERWLPYAGFHTGYKQTQMRPDEIVKAIRLPRRADAARSTGHAQDYYRKVGTRRAQAISKVCFVARYTLDGEQLRDVRIALGSVAPVTLRCTKTEAALEGQTADAASVANARQVLLTEIAPLDDIRSTRDYRRTIAGNLLEDCFLNARLAATPH